MLLVFGVCNVSLVFFGFCLRKEECSICGLLCSICGLLCISFGLVLCPVTITVLYNERS